ncbi:MAG TPA: hypothetical protein VFA28_10750 [Bryobacteraceae bacterium]|jgi:hypothetical protein|nr:hypothetical protein [Bryobacteraceae bacterium]
MSEEEIRKPYRQRRTRRSHFGELVQMDGSFENCWKTVVRKDV